MASSGLPAISASRALSSGFVGTISGPERPDGAGGGDEDDDGEGGVCAPADAGAGPAMGAPGAAGAGRAVAASGDAPEDADCQRVGKGGRGGVEDPNLEGGAAAPDEG